jgi:hypothetical protein
VDYIPGLEAAPSYTSVRVPFLASHNHSTSFTAFKPVSIYPTVGPESTQAQYNAREKPRVHTNMHAADEPGFSFSANTKQQASLDVYSYPSGSLIPND